MEIKSQSPKIAIVNQVGEDIGGSIEVYDPGLNQWRMQGTMQDARLLFKRKKMLLKITMMIMITMMITIMMKLEDAGNYAGY